MRQPHFAEEIGPQDSDDYDRCTDQWRYLLAVRAFFSDGPAGTIRVTPARGAGRELSRAVCQVTQQKLQGQKVARGIPARSRYRCSQPPAASRIRLAAASNRSRAAVSAASRA